MTSYMLDVVKKKRALLFTKDGRTRIIMYKQVLRNHTTIFMVETLFVVYFCYVHISLTIRYC